MAEVANNNLIDRGIDLGREAQELILEGIDKVKAAFGIVTVLKGKLPNGEDHAIVLGVDRPLELFAGDDTTRSERFLSKLRNNPLVKLVGGISLAAGAALGACSTNGNNADQPTGLSINQSALTYDQVLNVEDGQLIPWSEWGDLTSNYGEMDGEKYIFVGRSGPKYTNNIVYVKCQAIEDCLSANANDVKTVQGFGWDGVSPSGIKEGYTAGVYQDQNGNNKFIVNPDCLVELADDGTPYCEDGPVSTCDISTNTDGVLEISNCAKLDPSIGSDFSIVKQDGMPHAIYGINEDLYIRNLHTGIKETLPSDPYEAYWCGAPTSDGAVVGSHHQFYSGIHHCRLVTAASWQELKDTPTDLVSLNGFFGSSYGADELSSPRLAGNSLIYALYAKKFIWDEDGGYYVYDSKLWYALIPDVQQNPELDAGAPDMDAVQPDINKPDAINVPDADIQPDSTDQDISSEADTQKPNPDDITKKTAEATDFILSPEDAIHDVAQDLYLGKDTTLTPQPDADTPPKPDTMPNPDINEPLCDFANAKIKITEGSCLIEYCENPFVDITGKCAFEVDLGNPKPVKLEIDGTYNLNLFEEIGALLSGKFKVTDNGNEFGTTAGNIGIGVEGTIYRGDLINVNNYFIACDEGKITIYLIGPNGVKTPLTTLEAGDEHTFDMENPTAGLTEPIQDQGTGTNNDASITPKPGKDTTPATDTSKPSADSSSGCSCATMSQSGNFSELSLALLAIAGLLASRRKKTEKK